ncbi:MFS transporter [Sciscionella sediminilitoris]|uniref:MFS transporter n=1 Tax=Sciscionella sediminilitoris TaxID=1445613 RepID=UPI0004DFC4C1|nr:MFS transporter [Sciscionella sp. SE31]
MPDSEVAEHPDSALLRRVVIAAALGNFLEWFDFAVYGFMATLIGKHFFPSDDPTTSLLQTFAVFAVAFALRPIGGLVCGVLGDRIGRKRVLSLTVLFIGASTTVIGVLPTYQEIGITATLLLCLARAVQGFSAGGEYAGACTYVVEHAPAKRRARYSSFLPSGTFFAFAVAAGVSFAVSSWMSPAALDSWGWRIPFLVAAPVALLGFYIRHRLSETPMFRNLSADTPESAPLRGAFRTQLRTMLLLGGVISASGLSFYTLTTYMSTYVEVVGKQSAPVALLASVLALTFSAALSPFAGRISDRVGRKVTAAAAGIAILVTAIPAFLLAGQDSLGLIVLGQCLLAIGVVLSLVAVAVLLSELFPTRIRYTASALTYNIAYTLFGGTAPFVATFLISQTANQLSPGFYLMIVSVLALVCALFIPETAGSPLDPRSERRQSLAQH